MQGVTGSNPVSSTERNPCSAGVSSRLGVDGATVAVAYPVAYVRDKESAPAGGSEEVLANLGGLPTRGAGTG